MRRTRPGYWLMRRPFSTIRISIFAVVIPLFAATAPCQIQRQALPTMPTIPGQIALLRGTHCEVQGENTLAFAWYLEAANEEGYLRIAHLYESGEGLGAGRKGNYRLRQALAITWYHEAQVAGGNRPETRLYGTNASPNLLLPEPAESRPKDCFGFVPENNISELNDLREAAWFSLRSAETHYLLFATKEAELEPFPSVEQEMHDLETFQPPYLAQRHLEEAVVVDAESRKGNLERNQALEAEEHRKAIIADEDSRKSKAAIVCGENLRRKLGIQNGQSQQTVKSILINANFMMPWQCSTYTNTDGSSHLQCVAYRKDGKGLDNVVMQFYGYGAPTRVRDEDSGEIRLIPHRIDQLYSIDMKCAFNP